VIRQADFKRIGKLENFEKGSRKTPHQQVMSKLDRRNRAKQLRLQHHQEHAKATNIFAGRDGAPRIVAVVALCDDVSAAAAVSKLIASVDGDQVATLESGWVRAYVDRFKQKINFLVAEKEIWSAMDAARMADYVLFILSANEEVDSQGELILKTLLSQGISSTFAAVEVILSRPFC
jgi:pre-rRNA-processing protein TSR1